MKAYISNLGCKLNQAESEHWARRLIAEGHEVVGRLEDADVHLVNTCTVTHVAARDSRKVARRAGRLDQRIRTVVTGCYANDPEAPAGLRDAADLVVPNEAKDQLLEHLYQAFPEYRPGPEVGIPLPVSFAPLRFVRSRAAIKIEDGCNMRCAFCIIPITRGRQRSRPAEEIATELESLEAGGCREVVLTGVQISAYGDGDLSLYDLSRLLLARSSGVRVRLTSIAPWQFDPRLLDLLQEPRVCRHLHFSLQSGCNATLRRMRRPYTRERFADLLGSVRRAVPGVAVTTDVIVGFPGESEAEFDQSLEFVRSCRFAKTHVFTYSERSGTTAATMAGAVPVRERRRRTARLRAIAEEAEREFWSSQSGQPAEVLWEDRRNGSWRGTTDNYVRVVTPASDSGRARIRTGAVTQERLGAAGPYGVALADG